MTVGSQGISRKKTVAFISLIAVVHFGVMITLFISRMSCGMQADCVSVFADAVRDVLAFPLNVLSLALGLIGIDTDDLIRRYLHGEIVVVFLLNSLCASAMLWFVVAKPLMKAVSRRRRSIV
jgi:hypothetical protein